CLEAAGDVDLRLSLKRGQLDESVGQPPFLVPVVTLARLSGQRLQRVAQRGAADRIERPADDVPARLRPRQLQRALLRLRGLLGGVSLLVLRMPVVPAQVEEAAWRVLLSLLENL